MMREKSLFLTEKNRERCIFDYYKAKYQISVIIYTFSKECATYGTFRKGSDLATTDRIAKGIGTCIS